MFEKPMVLWLFRVTKQAGSGLEEIHMDESKRWLYSFTEYKTGTELFSFNGFTGLSNALGSKKAIYC